MRKILLAGMIFIGCLLRADAQVLVYDLSFNTTGPSVNYSFLEGGYLVVDVSAQAVTSVVILTDPTTQLPYYTTGLLSGTYMEMLEEGSGSEYAVVYSTSGSTGGDNIAFQILGKTSNNTGVGGGNSLSIARKLRGYLLASAAESLTTATSGNSTASSTATTSGNSTFSYGFAGSSKVTANLQSGLTSDSNSNRLDAATTLNNLTQLLENRGIFAESSSSSNSTSSNSTPTTSNSTTSNSTTSNSTTSQ